MSGDCGWDADNCLWFRFPAKGDNIGDYFEVVADDDLIVFEQEQILFGVTRAAVSEADGNFCLVGGLFWEAGNLCDV